MKELFNKMMLAAKSEPLKFSINRAELGGHHYINFMYTHAIENHDFNEDFKLEMRGIMFEVTANDEYMGVVSRPFSKFFNNTEHIRDNGIMNSVAGNMYGINLNRVDFDTVKNTNNNEIYKLEIKNIYEKLDGSIISTFMCGDEVMLKSNASVNSGESEKAMEILSQDKTFKEDVRRLTTNGWTIIFEMIWLHGTNNVPIVLNKEEGLYVLAVRNNTTGEYMPRSEVLDIFSDKVVNTTDKTLTDILNEQDTQEGIEGYVVETVSGFRYKIKTKWYFRQRYTDFGKVNKRMVALAFLNNDLDDMLAELTEDQLVLVKQWESEIKSSYQEIINRSLTTYEKFKDEARATFFKNAMITGKTGTIGSENYLVRILYTNQGDLSDALPGFNKYLLKGKNINYIL